MRSEIISTNPGRNFEEIGRVRCSTPAEIDQAVAAARPAAFQWGRMTIEERCVFIDRYRELLEEHWGEIAELQSKEMGKPIIESHQEIESSVRFLKNQTEKAGKLLAPRILDSYPTHRTEAHYEPYGVAAVIIPWNFPTSQFVANSSPLLLAGNVVVLKHSEECVLTSQLFASLIEKAGFPEGVFQLLYGDGRIGQFLLEKDIDFIHFTGSSVIGKEIYKKAAEKFVPVTLEMGGSSPAIVTEEVDLKKTARSVFYERFKNCGQICCALKRLYVQDTVVEKLVQELSVIAEQQVVGDPLEESTTLGPLAASRQLEELEDQLRRAKRAGASVVAGGSRPAGLEGAYFLPTIVTGTGNDSPLIQEEVFGPVLPVMSFETVDEAIELANDSPYGLSAFVYSEVESTQKRLVRELEAGQVSVNGASYFSNHAPFGGYKNSGIGRVRGDEGLFEATQIKVVGKPAE
ncbi:MAG: aldehyde dehydrogenase family protein [Longimicrobiales bacterium]